MIVNRLALFWTVYFANNAKLNGSFYFSNKFEKKKEPIDRVEQYGAYNYNEKAPVRSVIRARKYPVRQFSWLIRVENNNDIYINCVSIMTITREVCCRTVGHFGSVSFVWSCVIERPAYDPPLNIIVPARRRRFGGI